MIGLFLAQLVFLAQAEPIVGGVAGGTVLGTASWLVRRYLKKRDAHKKNQEAKQDRILETQQVILLQTNTIKVRLDEGEKRMDRMEKNLDQGLARVDANCTDIRHDMRVLKRRSTSQIEREST